MNVYVGEDSHGYTVVDERELSGYDEEFDAEHDYDYSKDPHYLAYAPDGPGV